MRCRQDCGFGKMNTEIYYYVGLYGALLYLAAYFLLQAGFVRGNSYTYTLLNLGASSCVAISLLDAFNAASFVIQASFIVLSIYGLVRMTVIHYTTRFSDEESSFLKTKLPDMPKNIARNLMKNAVWIDGKAGSDAKLCRRNDLPDGSAGNRHHPT